MGFQTIFTTDYYLRIHPDRIVARNISAGRSVEVVPEVPYLHPRLLAGNLTALHQAVANAVAQIKPSNPLRALRIRVLVHPVADFPGGFSEAEERIFRQVTYDAQPAQILVWTGAELDDGMVVQKLDGAL